MILKFDHTSYKLDKVFKSVFFGDLYWLNTKPLSICSYINVLSTNSVCPSSIFTTDGFLMVFNVKVQVFWMAMIEKCLLRLSTLVTLVIESNIKPKKFLMYKNISLILIEGIDLRPLIKLTKQVKRPSSNAILLAWLKKELVNNSLKA